MGKERSRAYPSLDLKVAVAKLESLARNLGSGSFNRDEAIIGMGYKGISGASQRAVAALAQYGLINRVKDTYTLGELGSAIVHPTEPGRREDAIRQAALKPSIFAELTEQYAEQGLPNINFLANMLATPRYGIGTKQKDEVAHTFVATMQYAGLLEGSTIVSGIEGFGGPDAGADDKTLRDTQEYDNDKSAKTAVRDAHGQQEPVARSMIRKLPSGIEVGFPPELDYAVLTGEFGQEIKDLEAKAQKFLTSDNDGKGPTHEIKEAVE